MRAIYADSEIWGSRYPCLLCFQDKHMLRIGRLLVFNRWVEKCIQLLEPRGAVYASMVDCK